MRTFICYVVCIISVLRCSLYAEDGFIRLADTPNTAFAPDIAPEIYGGFLELIYDAYTGPFGFCAQEFLNRGFDFPDSNKDSKPRMWAIRNELAGTCRLQETGYNENGVYSLQMNKSVAQGRYGVMQQFYTTRSAANRFYVHAKSANYKGSLHLVIYSSDKKTLYLDSNIGRPTHQWNKFETEFKLPDTVFKAVASIEIDSIGSVEIDEASLMPENNIFGARKEQYDLYKLWRPTILRFPGGGIADEKQSQWDVNVGDVDKRIAVTKSHFSTQNTRFEVGYNEFLQFCREIGAKPQLTANFGSGTPEQAAQWLEYCNGSSSSTAFGALRASHGYSDPFNVRHWEIGNEIYGEWETGHTSAEEYAKRYTIFYDKMKAVDSSIIVMPNADTWSMDWNKKMIGEIGNKIDLLSVHWGIGLNIDSSIFGDSLHKIAVRDAYFGDYWYDWMGAELQKYGLPRNISIGKTEHVFTYGSFNKYRDPRNVSMQHGLWSALSLNLLIKNCEYMRLQNATIFTGIIKTDEHKTTGERIVFGGASYYVHKLYRNTMRKYMAPLELQSPKYTFNIFEYNWVDAVATFDKDSIAIAVVNSHANNDYTLALDLPIASGAEAIVYTIHPPSVESYNSAENPTLVSYKSTTRSIGSSYTFPAHSVTVFVFPNDEFNSIDSDSENSNKLQAWLQPNPSNDKAWLFLSSFEGDEIQVGMTNFLGENIITPYSVFPANGKTRIPVYNAPFANGLYFWNISNSNGQKVVLPYIVRH